MALTLNLAVIPVVAGLVAGTGALATFATDPGSMKPMQQAAACSTQAWPYTDAGCVAKNDSAAQRVRIVSAPRAEEAPAVSRVPPAIPHVANPQPPVSQPAAPDNLQSRDTVLRSPDIVVPPKLSKRERRAEQRRERREHRERRWTAQSYSVPAEGRGVRPVIVVRPLRIEAYR
jgi:hypothetical protein